MAEPVDAIISQLEVRLDNYRKGYLEAIDLNKNLDKAEADLAAHSKARSAGSSTSMATERKRAAQDVAKAEEQSTQRIVQTRKVRTDAEKAAAAEEKRIAKDKSDAIKASAKAEADAIKTAAKEKVAAERAAAREIAAAQRQEQRQTGAAERRYYAQGPRIFEAKAREYSAADRVQSLAASGSIAPPTITPGRIGNEVTQAEYDTALARTAAARAAVAGPGPVSRVGAAPAASEKEINQALVQRIELQERLKVANEQDAVAIRAQLTELNLATAYERAGLEAKEAALRLDRELAVIEGQRAKRVGEQQATSGAAVNLYDLRARAKVAPDDEAKSLRDQIDLIQRRNVYVRAGYDEQEIAARIERETLAIEERRVGVAAEQTAMLERQMRAQQGAIANKISGAGLVAGGVVGGLGIAEVSHLNDEYIKLQNTLRVAGVGTQELDQVQGRLLTTANRTGTDINALADVYRGAALASKDLGASQSDLLKITDAAANALRISGRSSTEAQGALLQLSHAFESGRVTAREFNGLALNLYPILQAVAKGSEQWGGSVAKLRSSLVDGTVTSKEFFQALLKGSDDLSDRAAKSTLTTAQGFNSLRNSLIVYFGEADKAQGVSAALGEALQKLAENLDILIPAIAAVATALTVGYVARMAAAAIATKSLGASILGAFGGPVGLAISVVTVALASFAAEANKTAELVKRSDEGYAELQDRLKATASNATSAGSGIKGVGTDALGAIAHVNNFAGAVGNLAQQLYNQARAARVARVEMLQTQLQASQQKETDLASKTSAGAAEGLREGASALGRGNLARSAAAVRTFIGNRFGNLVTGGQQDRDVGRAYREQVAQSQDLQKQLAQAKSAPITAADIPGGVGGDNPNQGRMDKLQREIDDLKKIEGGTSGKRRASIDRQIEKRQQEIDALAKGATPAAATAGAYVPGVGGGRGKSAETLQNEETERKKRFSDQLAQIHDRYLQAEGQLTIGSDKQLDAQQKAIETERDKADADYAYQESMHQLANGAAKILSKQNDEAAAEDLKVVALRRQVEAYDQGTAAIDRQNQLHDELLQTQAAFARTASERLAIEQQRIEDERQRTKDAAIRTILSPDPNVSDAQRIAAGDSLRTADTVADSKLKVASHDNMGPWADYVDKLPRTAGEIGESFQRAAVDGVENLNSSLDKSISKMLHLHGVAGQFLDDIIKIALHAAEAQIFGGGQGGGGLGSLFGGYTSAAGSVLNGGKVGGGSGLSGLFGSIGKLFGLGGGINPASLSSAPLGLAGPSISGFGIDPALLTLPGFASGGSFTVAGNGGVDRNIMSINGQPVARVNRGEPISIGAAINPNTRVNSAGGGSPIVHQTIAVDARGAVMNDQFASQILSKAAQHANGVGAAAYQGAVRDAGRQAPGAVRSYQQQKG